MSKLAIFLALSSIIFLTSCKTTKNVQKSSTETEKQNKVDSSVVVKNDITKESKVKTVITEKLDTAVSEPGFTVVVKKDTVLQDGTRVEFKGTAVKITKPTRKIPVKINKRTETTADTKESDQSKIKTAVKKDDRKDEKVVTKDKEVEKTGFIPWWIYLILAMCLAAYLVWRFYLRRL